MPREEEMVPRDKYTMFDRKEKTYRKGVHSESTSSFYLVRDREGMATAVCWTITNPWV